MLVNIAGPVQTGSAGPAYAARILDLNEDSMSTQSTPTTSFGHPHSVRETPVSSQYAARFLNMHPKTVLRKAREGSLPAHPVGTERKRWHFYLSELDEWLRSQVITSRPSASRA
jgi:excisionase family DNA binding protein